MKDRDSIKERLTRLESTLDGLKEDITEIKGMMPRVSSLENFRSYVKGVAFVVAIIVSFLAETVRAAVLKIFT